MRRALVLLVAVSCSPARAPPPVAGTAEVPGSSASPVANASRVVVWTRPRATAKATQDPKEGEGEATSYMLHDDGTVVASTKGIVVAAPGEGELVWTTERVEVPTDPCDTGGGTTFPPQASYATRGSFVASDGTAQRVVDVGAFEGANAVAHDATILATLGPFAFIDEVTYLYSCGVHGTTTHQFFVWDLEHHRRIEVASMFSPDAQRAALAAAEPLLQADDSENPLFGDDRTLTEILPDLADLDALEHTLKQGQGGSVGFVAQVTARTCYACSDGRWSSYTRSVRVPVAAPQIHDSMLERRVPPSVALFLREQRKHMQPAFVVGGWSP